MIACGSIAKMKTAIATPVEYALPVDDELIPMNDKIGRSLSLRYTGEIFCIACGRKTNKSFNQGYCFPCFRSLAQCDMCIMKPETCHYDQGTCREPEWAQQHCMQPHIVYLANSSGLKVGITRQSQVPTRWIDQGAVQALPIIRVQTRFQSGLVEVVIKQHVSDRTTWQRMLKNDVEPVDLAAKRDELFTTCADELSAINDRLGERVVELLPDESVVELSYPVLEYPKKVKSFNFDKQAEIEGTLMGIKGQYLIFDSGVINIRKFAGYHVELAGSADSAL